MAFKSIKALYDQYKQNKIQLLKFLYYLKKHFHTNKCYYSNK